MQKNLGGSQGFFASVQVYIEGETDPLSGMVKNLTEVDADFDSVFKSSQNFPHFRSAALHLYRKFQKLWGTGFKAISLSVGPRTLYFDGASFVCASQTQLKFLENESVVTRNVRIKSPYFNTALLQNIRLQVWKSPENCLVSLQSTLQKPFSLEVEMPEMQAWMKWQV